MTVLPKLKTEYIDTGKVRLVFRDFPLDGLSLAAATVTRCVNDLAYFAMVDTFFAQQQTWYVENGLDQVKTIAKGAGMDEAAFNACIADPARKNAVIAEPLGGRDHVQGQFDADLLHQRSRAQGRLGIRGVQGHDRRRAGPRPVG